MLASLSLFIPRFSFSFIYVFKAINSPQYCKWNEKSLNSKHFQWNIQTSSFMLCSFNFYLHRLRFLHNVVFFWLRQIVCSLLKNSFYQAYQRLLTEKFEFNSNSAQFSSSSAKFSSSSAQFTSSSAQFSVLLFTIRNV